MADIVSIILGAIVLLTNCTTFILIFPTKRGIPFTALMLLLATVVFYTALYFLNAVVPSAGGLFGLFYLAVIILLFKGKLLHKTFAYFLTFIFTSFQVALSQVVGGLFSDINETAGTIANALFLLATLSVYIVLVIKYGRKLFDRLFSYGRTSEWVLYSCGAVFSFAVLTVAQFIQVNPIYQTLILLFSLFSFIILCFAIINTHEKSKQKYETEFAKDIISSGREHYQELEKMQDDIRLLRHDYNHHLNSIHNLLSSGNVSEAEKYLTSVEAQFEVKPLNTFCKNSVINALLTSYVQRCEKASIVFDAQISIPDNITVNNYEMCIILGNLLDNALNACSQTQGNRIIELKINTQNEHLAIMVKNNFNGEIVCENSVPVSQKPDGGFGLRSVKAAVKSLNGELMTEWSDSIFTAYVLI